MEAVAEKHLTKGEWLEPGPLLAGTIPQGADVEKALLDACARNNLTSAGVSLWGGLSSGVLASFDQRQQVYVTREFEGDWELASCTGSISVGGKGPEAVLHAVLTDLSGNILAGRLFPPTRAFGIEFLLSVWKGRPLVRAYHEETGKSLWNLDGS